jgi:hypothetical protein
LARCVSLDTSQQQHQHFVAGRIVLQYSTQHCYYHLCGVMLHTTLTKHTVHHSTALFRLVNANTGFRTCNVSQTAVCLCSAKAQHALTLAHPYLHKLGEGGTSNLNHHMAPMPLAMDTTESQMIFLSSKASCTCTIILQHISHAQLAANSICSRAHPNSALHTYAHQLDCGSYT